MGKYEVNYKCGCTETKELYGKIDARHSKVEWLEQGKCWECEKADKLAAAKEKAEESGLPELVGSEKQVAWAETIRASKIKAYGREIDGSGFRLDADDKARCPEVLKKYKKETSAKWWIDNRDNDLADHVATLPRKIDAKQVIKAAWKIARVAVEEHGKGTVQEYFDESLKLAWSLAREIETRRVDGTAPKCDKCRDRLFVRANDRVEQVRFCDCVVKERIAKLEEAKQNKTSEITEKDIATSATYTANCKTVSV